MTIRNQLEVEAFNSIALRKAKTLWSFGLSECKRVNVCHHISLTTTYHHPLTEHPNPDSYELLCCKYL